MTVDDRPGQIHAAARQVVGDQQAGRISSPGRDQPGLAAQGGDPRRDIGRLAAGADQEIRDGVSVSSATGYELSIVPFVLGILRYALILEAGSTAGPEEIVLRERSLQLMGLACCVLVGLGIYAK